MKKVTLFIGVLSIGLSLFTSCSGSATSTFGSEEVSNFLSEKQALIDAKEALMNLPKYKGKKVMVFQSVNIYDDGRIDIDVQDPENEDNIDNYYFDAGQWGEPTPVQISGGGDMSANVTPIEDVRFELIPDMVKIYEEKAGGIEGAEKRPTSMTFHLWVPNQSRYWSGGFIEGAREEYNLDFDLDGKVLEFEKR